MENDQAQIEEPVKLTPAERMAKARAAKGKKPIKVTRKDAVSSMTVKTDIPSVAIKVDQRTSMEKIKFFTEKDIDSHGRIKNEYPVHYNKKVVYDLK